MKKGEGSSAPQQPKKKKSKKNEQPAEETKPEEELPVTADAKTAEENPVDAAPHQPTAGEKPRAQVGEGFEK